MASDLDEPHPRAPGVDGFQAVLLQRSAPADRHGTILSRRASFTSLRQWRMTTAFAPRTSASNHEEAMRCVAPELFDQVIFPIKIGLHRTGIDIGALVGTPVAM